jgi:anti-anti-sigma factor
MGRFELFALADEGKPKGHGEPARWVPKQRRARPPAALRIEQTVIWAEARQISIRGELDLAGADDLRRVLAETVGSGLCSIVLDLSGCEFVDAGALGVIVGQQVQLAAEGQELVFHGATGQVARLIGLVGELSRQGLDRPT